ncbi:hypothetical protein [Rugamonas aquatica]|uniref:Lipoprotein n=1 Tax=Rugamonas aquatica TaxID=2743357 RepID=A0A6A7N694_9BURK|nr:hypothetical protein [Rugamonas aquatica]MQA40613.1 hypothetical protein [Rugamonas aquatica]
MKKLFTYTTACVCTLITAGCASLHTSSDRQTPVIVRAQYLAPRNDLTERFMRSQDYRRSNNYVVKVGEPIISHRGSPARAVQCESDVLCRHAVTLDVLDIQASAMGNSQVRVTGTVHSQIGRHLAFDMQMGIQGAGGPNYHFEDEIGAATPLLDEGKWDVPFSAVIKLGEKFEVPGVADAKFIIFAEQAKY